MTRLVAVLCLVALAGPGAASAERRQIDAVGNLWKPRTLNVLVGDEVLWKNRSFVNHDLKIGGYEELLEPNDEWLHPEPFGAVGSVQYQCTIHFGMIGSIAVYHAYMTGPAVAVLYGNAIRFNGLAPEGQEIEIQRDAAGTWTTVATTTAGPGDSFAGSVTPAVPGRYRALIPAGESPPVLVAVKPRVTLAKKRLPTKRTRVTATAAPNRAGAVAVLQRKKPAGWAALASKRLNTSSKAAFVVRPPKGTWRVRVIVKKSGGYAAGQSGVVAVKR